MSPSCKFLQEMERELMPGMPLFIFSPICFLCPHPQLQCKTRVLLLYLPDPKFGTYTPGPVFHWRGNWGFCFHLMTHPMQWCSAAALQRGHCELWGLHTTDSAVHNLILSCFGFILLWMSCSFLSGRNPENITTAAPTPPESFRFRVKRPPGWRSSDWPKNSSTAAYSSCKLSSVCCLLFPDVLLSPSKTNMFLGGFPDWVWQTILYNKSLLIHYNFKNISIIGIPA